MKPRERETSGQHDLFRSRLDQILDMGHAKVVLASLMDWHFLSSKLGEVYSDGPGQPPLATRLMAGLHILKYADNLSDDEVCARWLENPYYQYFCGEEFFCHHLPLDRSSLTRWRQRMGEERLTALLQESLAVAVKTKAAKPADFTRVIVDTTVAEKDVAFPTDAKLIHKARERLVKQARRAGIKLRQSYTRVGKTALIAHQRYAHAKQYKRARRQLRKLKTYLRRTIGDIGRKIEGDETLRVRPETLCRITEFSEHESNGRELDEGERVAVEVLPVLGQSAAAVEPGDGAFDHPTPGLDDEALHPIGSLDDLGLEIGQDAGQGAVKDRPLIGAVGEQFPEKGKQTEQGRQQRETAVAILNVGGGDDAVQQQALRIDQNMPLLALDQLAGIEAVAVDASPPFSALFTL